MACARPHAGAASGHAAGSTRRAAGACRSPDRQKWPSPAVPARYILHDPIGVRRACQFDILRQPPEPLRRRYLRLRSLHRQRHARAECQRSPRRAAAEPCDHRCRHAFAGRAGAAQSDRTPPAAHQWRPLRARPRRAGRQPQRRHSARYTGPLAGDGAVDRKSPGPLPSQSPDIQRLHGRSLDRLVRQDSAWPRPRVWRPWM